MNNGQTLSAGPWTLHECLGRGGNASVWRATRADSEKDVALKLINVKTVEREPYQRFAREIEFLRTHQDVPGLLPLLDAHLQDQPSKNDQPWLARPIATPIARALAGRPLADVVGAVAAIANTLARLQRDFDIAHRDVKPGNLYQLDGSWLIGDFGLVAIPDANGLTMEGRPVGAAHYTAYEMIINPGTANRHLADIDDPAPSLLEHVRQGGPARHVRPVQVDLEIPPPLVAVAQDDRRNRLDNAGAVDEDIDRAGRVEHRVHAVRLRDIGGDAARAAADVTCHGVELLLVPRGDDDLCTAACQRRRRATPDPTAAAGNQRSPVMLYRQTLLDLSPEASLYVTEVSHRRRERLHEEILATYALFMLHGREALVAAAVAGVHACQTHTRWECILQKRNMRWKTLRFLNKFLEPAA
jgi:Protein kinase domain